MKRRLLQGNHNARRGLDAAHGCLKRNITRAETQRYSQVELIQAGAGQASEQRHHTDAVDVQRHRIRGGLQRR